MTGEVVRLPSTPGRFVADSLLEQSGFELTVPPTSHARARRREGPRVCRLAAGASRIRTCMGLFLSSGVFGLLPVLCSERERPFFVPSPAIRFPERAEGVKGPKR